jgi:hypothetical protein
MASEPTSPVKTIFVGGAPRSGTTVTHAIICTAPEVCAHHPEISFVRPVFDAYAVGVENWDSHARWFFKTPADLRKVVWAMVRHPLTHVWNALKRPQVLCVKDPLLTPKFPVVKAVMEWPCQFVTVLRHPHDVVRSQQEVYARSGVEMLSQDVERICHEYLAAYAHLDDPGMAGAVLPIRYEDLGTDWQTEQLRGFTGLPGIDPLATWPANPRVDPDRVGSGAFFSPKYQRPLDTSRRLDPLTAQFGDIADLICAPLMPRYGYLPGGRVESW